jgi:hypothetical protein
MRYTETILRMIGRLPGRYDAVCRLIRRRFELPGGTRPPGCQMARQTLDRNNGILAKPVGANDPDTDGIDVLILPGQRNVQREA